MCIGFSWPGFASGTSCGSLAEWLPCLTANARCFKTDPKLAKVKPIKEGSNAFVITYLRRGKKGLWHRNDRGQRRVRICVSIQTTRPGRKEGKEELQVLRFHCSL